jgi:hypothetical protein
MLQNLDPTALEAVEVASLLNKLIIVKKEEVLVRIIEMLDLQPIVSKISIFVDVILMNL